MKIILISLAVINLITAILFAWDKWRAKKDASRIPEKTLLLWMALGPFGGIIAMHLFRHKTSKTSFHIPAYALAILSITGQIFAFTKF